LFFTIAACAVFLPFLSSCNPPEQSSSPDSPSFSLAGHYSDGTKRIPCYWKVQGSAVTLNILPGDSKDLSHGVNANGLVVSGDTTYIPKGNYYDGTKMVACYWTITGSSAPVKTDLSGGSGWTSTDAESGIVDGGVIYTCGYWTDGTNYTPCYWKISQAGTSRIDFSGETSTGGPAFIEGMWIDGSTILAVGHRYSGTQKILCYWIDGVATDLPVPVLQPSDWRCMADQIIVSNSVMYCVGTCWDGAKYVPRIWAKSGSTMTWTDLPGDGTHNTVGWGTDFASAEKYTSGYREDGSKTIACYWANAVLHDLPDDSVDMSHFAFAGGFYPVDSDLYITGGTWDGTKQVPCYWKISGSVVTRHDLPGDGIHDASLN
jgi:hypothetical protein